MKNFGFPRHVLIVGILFVSALIALRISSAQERTYKIGDRGPAGGWIFYDKGDSTGGWRYLEAAPDNLPGIVRWGCWGKSIPGAQGTAVGTGKSNTQAIIESCEGYFAARLASAYDGGGKNDWFLPSKDELNAIYENLHKNGIGGLGGFRGYWSSSEYDARTAWGQGFLVGSQVHSTKELNVRVRAIRAF